MPPGFNYIGGCICDLHEPGDAKQKTEADGTYHYWYRFGKFFGQYCCLVFLLILIANFNKLSEPPGFLVMGGFIIINNIK